MTRRPMPDAASVLTGAVVFCVVLALPAILADSDTRWQIATGNWILAHHAIPSTDPFSYTATTRRWFAHEWLAEVIMAAAFRAAGMAGVMVLAATASGLAAAMLMQVLRRFLPGSTALTMSVFAFAAAGMSLLARPHLLAWPCLVLWCGAMVLARARRSTPSYAVLPVMALWVNLHGSFMVGLLLPGAFALEAMFDPGAHRRRVVLSWAAFSLAATATALLNPEFVDGLVFPFRHLRMESLARIGEWFPADFSNPSPVEGIILILLGLGLSGALKLPPVRLILTLGLIHEALVHVRNSQLLGIVGAMVLAEPFARSLGHTPAQPLGRFWRPVPALAAAAMVAATVLRLLVPVPPEYTGATVTEALDALPPALRTQPVLNGYGLGADLIVNGIRPFIDSRADLYGDAFVSRYARVVALDIPEIRRILAEYGITWTVFPEANPIIPVLDLLPGWRRVLERGGIIVHIRTDGATPIP